MVVVVVVVVVVGVPEWLVVVVVLLLLIVRGCRVRSILESKVLLWAKSACLLEV